MKKILFPIDFSTHNASNFQYALSLADVFEAELLLLHAFGAPISPDESPDFEQRASSVVEELMSFVEEYKPASSSVKINYEAEVGFAADVILATAKEAQVDLIIMGTKGKTNILNRYLGGVSTTVMNKANCPLLLIPPAADFNGLKHFGCTTNFSFDDLLVLNTLAKWSDKFNTGVTCLHVLVDGEDMSTAEAKVKILKEVFSAYSIRFQIKSGAIKDAIHLFETEARLGLLGMIHHPKNLIAHLLQGDITESIVSDLKVPLLVFNQD